MDAGSHFVCKELAIRNEEFDGKDAAIIQVFKDLFCISLGFICKRMSIGRYLREAKDALAVFALGEGIIAELASSASNGDNGDL